MKRSYAWSYSLTKNVTIEVKFCFTQSRPNILNCICPHWVSVTQRTGSKHEKVIYQSKQYSFVRFWGTIALWSRWRCVSLPESFSCSLYSLITSIFKITPPLQTTHNQWSSMAISVFWLPSIKSPTIRSPWSKLNFTSKVWKY